VMDFVAGSVNIRTPPSHRLCFICRYVCTLTVSALFLFRIICFFFLIYYMQGPRN
jgi:hypothetical protein